MNKLVTPTWLKREAIAVFIGPIAPPIVPLLKRMSDEDVDKFAEALAREFASFHRDDEDE